MAKKKYTPEELMELAIEESLRSVPEHQDKTDPLVGAIIATQEGEVLGAAHRGELRIGEHCEFTLIERKLRDRNLKDCVLYVTLEPCTDKSRSAPKKGCSTHILKARLATIYVGIEDPNPDIAKQGIEFLEANGIRVHMFTEPLQERIRQSNTMFLLEKEEEAKQVRTAQPVEKSESVLEQPANVSIQAFSGEAISKFVDRAKLSYAYPSHEFTAWASQFGILVQTADGPQPTGLGLMLFGTHPERSFPQTVFKVSIYYNERDEPEVRDFSGPLVMQLPAILDYVRDKALKLTMSTAAGYREEVPDFPFDALREAIANAIIHRDYTIEGANTSLEIHPDRIILRSPGGPPVPLTLTDMQQYDVSSVSRNPRMMYVFNQMKLAEQRGIGMSRIKRLLQQQGLPLPVIELKQGSLELVFGRTAASVLTGQPDAKPLPQYLATPLIWMQHQGSTSAGEYAERFGLNLRTAQRQLSEMRAAGYVELSGRGRGARYQVISQGNRHRDKERDKNRDTMS